MAEETITILRVGTEEAVKSVNDLRNNIKILKIIFRQRNTYHHIIRT